MCDVVTKGKFPIDKLTEKNCPFHFKAVSSAVVIHGHGPWPQGGPDLINLAVAVSIKCLSIIFVNKRNVNNLFGNN